ncbi:urease accessory protein UreD [Pseudoduganella ginsengisoli]|nr:urease accessory protein UreD [Pseudoduganella ginsengisoli]
MLHPSSADCHAGWHAHLSLAYARDSGATRLTGRRHSGPLRVQKPLYPEGPDVCHTIVIHPPGGVVGGDRLALDATAAEGAHVVLTTPGAAKWYRANGKTSGQQVQLTAGAGAAIEWLPQESIFYDDAHVELQHGVELAADASYVGCEILCLGRRASGESLNTGRIHQRTHIRRGGKLLWWEQGVLTPHTIASPLGLAGHTVCATLLAVGAAFSADLLAAVRALGESQPGAVHGAASTANAASGAPAGIQAGAAHWGATLAGKHVLAVRHLGHDSEAARELMLAAMRLIRPALLGRAALAPRSWRT